MDRHVGSLYLTENEVKEIDKNPELIHEYNARLIWWDLKIGQELLAELKKVKREITAAIAKAEGR